MPPRLRADVSPDGVLVPPVLDVEGYLECLHRCRDIFPDLRILSGVELSEPHWHTHRAADLIDLGNFDRVLGSVHSIPTSDARFLEIGYAHHDRSAAEVVGPTWPRQHA